MWTTFAALTGGAAAGLTGIIFIVVAFRFDIIAMSREYRNRAAQMLSLFLTVLVMAALVTVPQSTEALGTELVLIAVGIALLLRFLDAAARREQTTRPNAGLAVALTVFVLFIGASGLLSLTGREWGMYFYIASAIVGLLAGVNGAWTFLTKAGMERSTR